MAAKETKSFQSEVKQLLHLMIHSLYSNKEIFLRELISNASDAADKLRFRALSHPEWYENDGDLRVRIAFDKEAKTLTISDNGIGMTREEVIENLGTIAKSGTKAFLESIGSDQVKDSQLIGQFGVGFYSAFIVAAHVTVKTRAAGESTDKGVLWESEGHGEYSIEAIQKESRGTEITLHMREEGEEFLNEWTLKNTISKYSDHIALPIELQSTEEVPVENEEGSEDSEKETSTVTSWVKINDGQALWTRTRSEISDEEYKSFYQHLSHDSSEPLIWSHNRVEGKQEYTSLLYIPSKAPWDLWQQERQQGLKLYVNRVFIMDDADQFMPRYLRFVHGVIDSSDLPLNVSREILQDSKVTQSLRNACTKRVLQMLEKLSNDDNGVQYQKFWQEFGLVMKEGMGEDYNNRETLAKLMRFASTHTDSSAQTVSLQDYVSRMQTEQDKIYFITSDSYSAAKNNPHLELLRKKGIEVLLMSDRIDEWMMNMLTEFEGKPFISAAKADASLKNLTDVSEEKQQEVNKEFASFITRVKTYLGSRVKNVRLTYRLTETPVVVTTDADDMTTQMAKIFAAAGQTAPEIQYIFEINPEHAIVKNWTKVEEEETFNNWAELLFEQALLAERNGLEDPHGFIRRMNTFLQQSQ